MNIKKEESVQGVTYKLRSSFNGYPDFTLIVDSKEKVIYKVVAYDEEENKVEKVKLPKDVSDAIQTMYQNDMKKFAIICSLKSRDWTKKYGCKIKEVHEANDVLYEYSFGDGTNNTDKIIEALVNGYEIEYTPEEQVKYYWEALMARRYKSIDEELLEKVEAEIHGIEVTLKILGVEIEGLNVY